MSESSFDILEADCGTLRPDLVTSRQTTAQGRRVLVRHPDTGKTFLFSEGAFRVLESLKSGKPARHSIAAAFADGLEQAPATAELIARAYDAALLTGAVVPEDGAKSTSIAARALRWNPLYIRIPILDPQPIVRSLRPLAKVLFHRWAVRVWALALASIMAALLLGWNRDSLNMGIFAGFAWWPVLYAAMALSAAIHESAHVMMCDRYGVAVKQVGLLFYFFNPGAYADVSGAWMLPERGKRVAIALAGLYVESILWIFVTAYWLTTEFGALHEIAFVVALCLAARILLNLIPFLRLDGYWVLTDSLGMPNLRSSAFAYLAAWIPGVGSRNKLRVRTNRKQSAILLLYGSAAVLFLILAITMMVGNIFALAFRLWPDHPAAGFWLTGSILLILLVLLALNLWARAVRLRPRNN